MNRNEAQAFLAHFHETRKRNDPEATLALFHEDATFSIAGEPHERSLAVQVGGRELTQVAQALVTQWEWQNVDFRTILADGDLIVVRYILTVRHVPTDRTVTSDVVDFITVTDGKVADMRQYIDTAYLGAVARGEA